MEKEREIKKVENSFCKMFSFPISEPKFMAL